jgi:hypothetical protein
LGNWGVLTHTHKRGEGRKEGTWTASDKQQQENRGKHNKGREQAGKHPTSRQNKGKGKRGGKGGIKHTEPNPERQKGKSEKGKGKKETGKEGRGCPNLCALHPWNHQGKRKVHPALLVYPRSHQRRGKGERN